MKLRSPILGLHFESKTMKVRKQTILFYLLAVMFTGVFNLDANAWGGTGHRAIAQIAYDQLNKSSIKKIEAILGDAYLPLYATWPDDIRSEHDNPLAKLPHYVNMDLDKTYADAPKHEHGDIVTILNDMIATVKDPNATTEDKAVALKFIIHLVGDIHQPMHVGLAEDLGGNKVDVQWFKENSNLHKVWDENLIDNTHLSYTELARFAGKPSKAELDTLYTSSFADWVDESHVYTRDIYENLGDKKYSYEYRYKYMPVVYQQIQKAGFRLGNLLNELLKEI